MTNVLTKAQIVGLFAERYHAEHGWTPTAREIMAGTGLCSDAVAAALLALRRAGFVTWRAGKRRTLVLVKPVGYVVTAREEVTA